ncbi:MAG: acyltransferase [Zunongwangia sp.]|uniref:acyltransferase n=1 Tax=Zunongwangia sp. TaxID=1965325 RepID=UPI003241EE57
MKRILRFIILKLQSSKWLHSKKMRPQLLRLAGVKIGNSHVGEGVIFDSLFPNNIEIGDKSTIAMRCIVLTHFVVPRKGGRRYFIEGKVKIGDRVFIGANSVICKPLTIGDCSIVAAGSILTKDIPPYEIWGGVPAKMIKKIEREEE